MCYDTLQKSMHSLTMLVVIVMSQAQAISYLHKQVCEGKCATKLAYDPQFIGISTQTLET